VEGSRAARCWCTGVVRGRFVGYGGVHGEYGFGGAAAAFPVFGSGDRFVFGAGASAVVGYDGDACEFGAFYEGVVEFGRAVASFRRPVFAAFY